MEIYIAKDLQEVVSHLLEKQPVECSPEQYGFEVAQLFAKVVKDTQRGITPDPNTSHALKVYLQFGKLPIN